MLRTILQPLGLTRSDRLERFARPALEALEDRVTPVTLPTGFAVTANITGLASPTAMQLVPDGRIFVTEQGGALRVIENGQLLATPFLTVATDSSGERGLLGVTIGPNFAADHFVYVYYTVPGSPAHNRVSRFAANGNVAVANSEQVLLDLPALSSATNHNGGPLHFGTDGKLYIGVGENANGANSQTLSNTLGKILRINPDGSIPSDNPFFTSTTGINRAIYALGFRNPFTFAVQPGTGRIFVNDVGQNAFEEIDNLTAGGNYGWPNAEGFGGAPTYIDPVFAYPHGSGTSAGFAITGGDFYNPASASFPSNYIGEYFFADLVNKWVRVLDPQSGNVTVFSPDIGNNTVDVDVSANGGLLVLTRGSGSTTGTVTRVDYTNSVADQRYIQALYNDFLGHAATASDLSFWMPYVTGIGRQAVAQIISHSSEANGHLVDGLYQKLLNRSADSTGRSIWVSLLTGGWTAEQVMAGILASAEFQGRANAIIGGSNAGSNYIGAVYRLLLNHDADAFAINFWSNYLGSQGSQFVAFGIVTSAEFRNGAIRTFYGDPAQTPRPYQPFFPNLLRRSTTPTQNEIDIWQVFGGDLLSIETRLAATNEYYGTRTA